MGCGASALFLKTSRSRCRTSRPGKCASPPLACELLPLRFMILAISIRPTLFAAPIPKRAIRTLVLLFAAALPVVAVSAL